MKQSSRTTGVVQGAILTYQQHEGEAQASVGSAAWFRWLEQATAFTFRDEAGHFTAHKTRAGNQRGKAYWRASRRLRGRLFSYYLGPSARLTAEHLRQAAQALSLRADDALLEQEAASPRPRHFFTQPVRTSQGSGLAPPSLLPRPLTRLLGRASERAQLVALLHRFKVRLLTLTGPGGVGKTRLALEAAHDLVPDFADSVYYVPLSAISEPDFVLPAIAQTLGVREMGARSPLEVLQAALADQALLLLLDNFEQVLPAAPQLTQLLAACPGVKLLVTSRAVLHVQGEHEFAVPPLALPNLSQLPSPEVLAASAAVALFVQRAQAALPTFEMNTANARAIAELCVQLDGLPLAIELAAARIKLLSPQAQLARLGRRLELLTSQAQDVPTRHQTLRNTMSWSYQLLEATEQRLFRRLCVFVGGCTLEAVEAVCSAEGDTPAGIGGSVLDMVASLIDKSLLQQTEHEGEETRLMLLQTIREYGLECLQNRGELEASRTAHAAYYLRLSEQAEPQLRGTEQTHWLAQLEQERENLRAALSFLFEQARLQAGTEESQKQAERALRFCVALSWFWSIRGYGREGLRFLEQALAYRADVGAELRARALSAAATLPHVYVRHMQLERLVEESLTVYQELGDSVGIATSLYHLGSIARTRSQFVLARERLEDAAARFQKLGHSWNQGQCFTDLSRVATAQGQYEQARAWLEESLVLYQTLGDTQRIGWVRYLQARLFFLWQQDLPGAQQLAEQSLALFRQQDDTFFSLVSLGLIGLIRLEQGELLAARSLLEDSVVTGKQRGIETDITEMWLGLARLLAWQGDADAARRLYRDSLTLLLASNVYKELVAEGLEGLAALETAQGRPSKAAQLWGAAEALREAIGASIYPVNRDRYERAVAQTRAALGEPALRASWAEGRLMTPQQALAAQELAMLPTPLSAPSVAPPLHASTSPFGLTVRELEVLRLLAQGLSDAQIAEHLVISPRTVNHHTTSLYSKLGVSSRAGATHYAIENHLL